MIRMLRNMIKRCRVTRSYPDNKNFPFVQVEFNDKVTDVEVIMPYGLSAKIPVDALGHKLVINGDASDQAAIFNTPTKRFKLAADGEVAVGNPLTGAKATFFSDGRVLTETPSGSSIDMPADGSIVLQNGNGYLSLNANGTVTINGIVFDTHVHGGVTPGGSDTGGPA